MYLQKLELTNVKTAHDDDWEWCRSILSDILVISFSGTLTHVADNPRSVPEQHLGHTGSSVAALSVPKTDLAAVNLLPG